MNFVIDIDGTVANNSHRTHFIMGRPKELQDWAQFHRPDLVALDLPIVEAVPVLNYLQRQQHSLYFLTGRQEDLRDVTLTWMEKVLRFPITSDILYMRETGNHEPAVKFKQRVINDIRSRAWHKSKEDGLIFLDDDERNFEMYSLHGLVFRAPECWGYFMPWLNVKL